MEINPYLNPIAVTEQPRQDLIRYLLTAYPLRDPHLRYALRQQLEQPGTIWQYPYLEGSQPYRSANSIQQLIESGVLHPAIGDLFIPANRSLYLHQERAVRSILEKRENIVVATGTGSGKTECFLIPILDTLLKEGENSLTKRRGVRVLILYPMNALVNDQVKRLRQLLCRQKRPRIRFGFYTSRTESEPKQARKLLAEELKAYSIEDLRKLFPLEELKSNRLEEREILLEEAVKKVSAIQVLSREECWNDPPHILLTNYSMLEHMMIRPKERSEIFENSRDSFQFLIVDEAHTYNGATGTEVSLLLKRLKNAIGIEGEGKIRCIATSASLGDRSVDAAVLQFAGQLFGEKFAGVIRGDRVTAQARLGEPYREDSATDRPIREILSTLSLPPLTASLEEWSERLRQFVPVEVLQSAREGIEAIESDNSDRSANDRTHRFLWFALKRNPLFHRLIDILSRNPAPWYEIARSSELWDSEIPETVGEDPAVQLQLEKALAYLVQLGTLARENPDDLPLLPVRLHLLFRGLEGVYACINSACPGAVPDPDAPDRPPYYGRLYLNEKHTCDDCDSPVLELGSCRQCGQAYAFAALDKNSRLETLPRSNLALQDNPKIYTLTTGALDSITEEEDNGEVEEDLFSAPKTFFIDRKDGWLGTPSPENFPPVTTEPGFALAWHRQKTDKKLEGCYLPKCAACGSRSIRSRSINRFVTYTDEPLQAMIDSLFDLLPEPEEDRKKASRRKLLSFSDGRQDAAFFASDYQRNHTETIYRQMVWRAFQEAKDTDNIASVNGAIECLSALFLETSIPHPDREASRNYLSYCLEDKDESLENPRDCKEAAKKRAKELLLREFALPFNRRSNLEAYTFLACHIGFKDENFINSVASKFQMTKTESRIFLTVLTDIIRRAGIVSIEGSSSYFPETGGDGIRRAMVDGQGKATNYLFLEKSPENTKKYADSPSFLPKKKKDGHISKAQNRLGWYYYQLFGEEFLDREREPFIWLFERLKESRILVDAKNGCHLNWQLLDLIATREDWYQCNCCRQIFHIPELSKIDRSTSKLNIFGCIAYKCQGTLQPYTPDRIDRVNEEHYQQSLIKNRSPLPLRSKEHTAQLSVIELEKRENRFRQGKINLLSSSTTLEVGVDIGELQAVVLRNFPPYVSNYQQRAGRAGRRTDGVSVTLMYGQRRPHDRFFFERPELLIAGINQIPQLDPDNAQIQQRHLHAELLATFLREERGTGAEQIAIGDFLGVTGGSFDPIEPDHSEALSGEFQDWLRSDLAEKLTLQWLERLESDPLVATPRSRTAPEVLKQFRDILEKFENDQIQDWNSLAKPLAEIDAEIRSATARDERKKKERSRDNLEIELEKIAKRRLHDELARASILPIYGFPIDVVRLLTGKSDGYRSSRGKHRLERDRRLALGEYAPGQDIVVDDRVYRSVGVVGIDDLERQFYWVCKHCNYFEKSQIEKEPYDECPECNYRPDFTWEGKFKAYVIPKTFTTDLSKEPEVTPYLKPIRQPTSQVFLASDGEDTRSIVVPDLYELIHSRGGLFFLANQGPLAKGRGFKNRGFALCKFCGIDLSDRLSEQVDRKPGARKKDTSSASPSLPSHNHPLTGKVCSGSYDYLHLGHEFRSDLLKISFDRSVVGDRPLYSSADTDGEGLAFWRSFLYAFLAAAAETIDVPRNELDGLCKPADDRSGMAELVIYDNVPGGAGYSQQIARAFGKVLEKTLGLADSCTCDTSCYDCLRTYTNQTFHAELNRHAVVEFLKPLVNSPGTGLPIERRD
ncbi:DEAD/DEAH box helicase [Pannus brasiliensis CCIBt3594]|uniref:DEAD/DEAH box helicase n=1 Tax=Pannus brasiliensis CCIBt3594 TaxID=1427578 RepID=A0AAW9QQY0_9CHRO